MLYFYCMPKPYDAVTKRLIELRPADWVDFLGLPKGQASLIDADLSTISTFADRLIHVAAPIPYCLHNELESGKNTATIPLRLFHYNAAAYYKVQLPIVSTVFLLHKAANSPQITGQFAVNGPDGVPYFTFSYHVVRVWELDAERLLSGGLSLLPFAPIARVTEAQIPGVIAKMEARIEADATNETEAAELWVATNVLMGLRYNSVFKEQVLRGVRRMRESITYQEILEEGRIEGELQEARRMVLRAGFRRLGMITAINEARIKAITSLTVLEGLLDRIFDVETWEDLLHDLP